MSTEFKTNQNSNVDINKRKPVLLTLGKFTFSRSNFSLFLCFVSLAFSKMFEVHKKQQPIKHQLFHSPSKIQGLLSLQLQIEHYLPIFSSFGSLATNSLMMKPKKSKTHNVNNTKSENLAKYKLVQFWCFRYSNTYFSILTKNKIKNLK